MRPLRRAVLLTLFLGALAMLAVVASFLALADIGHGESDLTLEWSVLRAAFLVIVLFQISTLITLSRVFRVLR
ncbi:MAG: hypothetical protein ACYSUQ_10090 [Planctomycetota bacterium]|jgi:hypothetical protein